MEAVGIIGLILIAVGVLVGKLLVQIGIYEEERWERTHKG